MDDKKEKGLVPELRFPEFINSGEWEEKKLGDISNIIKNKVGNRNVILMSITAGKGLISQLEKFGREIAGSSYKNYILITKGDFAYNKSATKQYASGYIAMLKDYDEAAVPNSIFLCFRVDRKKLDIYFIEHLFCFNIHDKWLRQFISVGARSHGSLNIDNKDFFEMPILFPPLSEQKKIADCLSSIDELIKASEEKLELLKKHKKGLMQQLFPNKIVDGRVPPPFAIHR